MENTSALTGTLESRFNVGDMLGEGGFGSVYRGRRISDGLQVAIKIVQKCVPTSLLEEPLEVALMKKVSQPPVCQNIIRLIGWFNEDDRYILVLERPQSCMDIQAYLKEVSYIGEETARIIMLQTLEAVSHCTARGVMHRDIKPENLLINTDTLEVKLIDFGCGDLISTDGYNTFNGTMLYAPPEVCLEKTYHADPATVWSLGVTLFEMVCGRLPFTKKEEIILGNKDYYRTGLSKEFHDLIEGCLQSNPSDRPSLEQIKEHKWFQRSGQP